MRLVKELLKRCIEKLEKPILTSLPVLCNVCGRVFPSSKALSQHLRYGHDKSCFDCGEVFRKSGMLIYHRYKVHGIEGDMDAITCVHCKKIFTCSDQKK